jgi:hypothetical protein
MTVVMPTDAQITFAELLTAHSRGDPFPALAA